MMSSSILTLALIPAAVSGLCTCDGEEPRHRHNRDALMYKLISIAAILAAGGIGVGLPFLGRKIHSLRPENDVFFMIKAFAAGVILATGFIHILPDAFSSLTSPCLHGTLWADFPVAGFVAMMAAVATLTADTAASGFFRRNHVHVKKQVNVIDPEGVDDGDGDDDGHVHVHTHATHGHAHGAAPSFDLARQRIISKVMEVGIVVHSVIIGVSLGASQSVERIKPLLAALSFHQFFEGMGLGACISQAKFESWTNAIMMMFFSLTTPVGVGVGIGISSFYTESSRRALIVEGVFNSASAGILIYMALVDLLAADFMNPRMQNSVRLQLGAYTSLLLGAGCMSILARWA